MRSKKTASKIDFYLSLIQKIKEGKKPVDISRELNMSKQSISYYTRTLRDLGFIEKKGYGVWEVKRSKKIDLEHALNWKDKKIRAHAFIWKVRTEKNLNWINYLDDKKISYNLVRGYTPRLKINGQKVWLAKNNIIVYDSRSFYGKNATEARKYAVIGLVRTLQALKKKLGTNLGKYWFRPSREHYGMIKNELARQCNEKGEKINVRDDLDGEWLWIDDSDGMLGELETGGKGITQERSHLNTRVQSWWNDHKKHNFEVTPTFLMENMNNLINNQTQQSEQIKSFAIALNKHIPVYEGMHREVKELKETIKELRKEIHELKGKN
ncbi:MAG: hypothetical protein ACOC44_19655 [Promethearchaeia archaeon]